MLLDIKPFEEEIEPGFLNVEYNEGKISNINWLDQDSIRFTKLFHYKNEDLFLITELRESLILKEIYFTNHLVTDRFINYSTYQTRYNPIDEDGEMLVICYDSFCDEMDAFVDWKNQKGIKTLKRKDAVNAYTKQEKQYGRVSQG